MDSELIINKIKLMKEKFSSSNLKNPKYRVELLKKLKNNIILHKNEIFLALKQDLNKSEIEAYMCEVGIVLDEISYMIKHCKKFAKPIKVKTSLAHFPAKSYKIASPYGCVFVISPWNYPFLLTLCPIVDAISAGNCVVVKPSETSKNVQLVLGKIIEETFKDDEVLMVYGGRDKVSFLLDQDFDYIFFTGSTRVGKTILEKASVHLTPVTLEMGGKSPAIVDETANIELSAKRIIFGKLLNAGQTCIAPDYVYCDEKIKDKLIEELKKQIVLQYSNNPIENQDYPKLINKRQFDFVKSLIVKDKVLFGGNSCENCLKIEPTLLDATFNDDCMQNEIFGPVLPIVTFKNLDEVVKKINSLNKPLAFYVFSNSKQNQNKLIYGCDFGGGCINDTIIHISNNNLPFGGVKQSGMGAYHGKAGFETFSHYKSILNKKNWLDLSVRYQPYTKNKYNLIKKFLK